MTLQTEVIAHHLEIFGVQPGDPGFPLLLDRPSANAAATALATADTGRVVIASSPNAEFLDQCGVAGQPLADSPPLVLSAMAGSGKAWGRVRTLHAAQCFLPHASQRVEPIVVEPRGGVVWGSLAVGAGQLFLLGTDLAADLVRYRQGDPQAASNRPSEAMWGIPGERPNYLYEKQLEGCHPHDRPADWWCWVLRDALQRLGGLAPRPILPEGAVGAVIVTGDDDQAPLASYVKQKRLLADLPVTYFLHPLTKHDRASLAELSAGRTVEWGLHPDALDAPENYASLFSAQFRWFERMAGYRPKTIRNHGFLNDGYWGHTPAWLEHGIVASSNLPGVDGRVLNGSLLPARLVYDGALTEHWSVVTAIGDGIMFAFAMDPAAAKACVRDAGRRIIDSGVPGVLVVNLHPTNVDTTECMHQAIHELVGEGFIAMTLVDAVDWFSKRHWAKAGRPSRRGAMAALHALARPEAWRSFWRELRRSAT